MAPFLHFPLPVLQSWAANYISIAGWQGVYKWTILDLSLSTFFVPSFPKACNYISIGGWQGVQMYISRRRLAVRDGAVGLRYNYR